MEENKKKALDLAIASIEKQFGKGLSSDDEKVIFPS